MEKHNHVTIAGAGLVGSLLSVYLAKRGCTVEVLEKREDPRTSARQEGRSINLALSHRGLKALHAADPALPEDILAEAVPMFGRAMHDEQARLSFQPYGDESQCIYSVSRSRLNQRLIDRAEACGVSFLFEHQLEHADPSTQTLRINYRGMLSKKNAPVFIAADGAFSTVRRFLEAQGHCQSTVEKINHGYKELDIAPAQGKRLAQRNALHIWPRGAYMLIALPNFDGSYTGTLFLPFEGEASSFEQLQTKETVTAFFHAHFPDALELIPDLAEQFFHNPTSFLANVYTDRWNTGSWLLIGDAAHAIVPFYGQGMNAGFEDCRLLNETLDRLDGNWSAAFQHFGMARKTDTDAIARLAMDNFVEMRNRVADEKFLLQKKIEAALSKAFPDRWKTLYSEVTFSDTPYSEALARGRKNDQYMQSLLLELELDENNWNEPDIWNRIVSNFKSRTS